MPLMPGEAEGVAANNAREAANMAQSGVERLAERLRQLEVLVGHDTRNDYEKVADHFEDRGVRAELRYVRYRHFYGRTGERNPTPCIVVIDREIVHRAATWAEVLKEIG